MKQFLFSTSLAIFLTAPSQISAHQAKSIPVPEKNSASAEKIALAGIRNAGKVSEHLFRGAQPDPDGVQSLQKLGITTIIDLRGEDRRGSAEEKKQAEHFGMKFVLIPNDGWSNPTDAQMA